jgi:hypothetical protein
LQLAGGVLGAGVATAVAACGGDDSAAGAACSPTAPQVSISANHRHTMTVTGAEITAAVTKMYDIKGQADHTHMVSVSDVNFKDLAAGRSVTAFSTSGGLDGHTHTITIC